MPFLLLVCQGFTIDTSSNFALATSLRDCANKSSDDIEFVKLLKTMATMAMSEASYISSGSKPVNEYAHYGLALEFYTHFTVSQRGVFCLCTILLLVTH